MIPFNNNKTNIGAWLMAKLIHPKRFILLLVSLFTFWFQNSFLMRICEISLLLFWCEEKMCNCYNVFQVKEIHEKQIYEWLLERKKRKNQFKLRVRKAKVKMMFTPWNFKLLYWFWKWMSNHDWYIYLAAKWMIHFLSFYVFPSSFS